jgi:Na+/glutamate symporter
MNVNVSVNSKNNKITVPTNHKCSATVGAVASLSGVVVATLFGFYTTVKMQLLDCLVLLFFSLIASPNYHEIHKAWQKFLVRFFFSNNAGELRVILLRKPC